MKIINKIFVGQNMVFCKILFVFLLINISMAAKIHATDSTIVHSVVMDTIHRSKFQLKIDKIGESRLFRATYIGVPLIAGGLVVKHENSKFRRLRNDFMPEFHRPLDNYMQIAPAAVMLGLKAIGVPSRSSWGRMVVSDVFATALMTGTVQGLKNSTQLLVLMELTIIVSLQGIRLQPLWLLQCYPRNMAICLHGSVLVHIVLLQRRDLCVWPIISIG